MEPLHISVNPFTLMLDPQSIVARIERSERLERLHRRVCRPLDKPMLGTGVDGTEASTADQDNDGMVDDE